MKHHIVKRLFSIVIISSLCLTVFIPGADSEINPDEAARLYSIHCEFCHLPSGIDDFPNKNTFTSASDLIDAYNGVASQHQTVNFSCNRDCVENTNTYIWEVLWGNTPDDADDANNPVDPNDPDDADIKTAGELYTARCASCHGASATDAFPNLVTFTSADELNHVYPDAAEHDEVADCDSACINTTNTYIWETLWRNSLPAAELYTLKCAECHGASARDEFPNKNTFTSEADLISTYADARDHDDVDTCSAACIETTNSYIWNNLWDSRTPENTGCFIHSMRR